VPATTQEIPSSWDAPKPSLISRLYGTVPAPTVLYHPWRSHYWPYQDIYTHLCGVTFKSIAYFSFINSYSERCHLIAFRRNWHDGGLHAGWGVSGAYRIPQLGILFAAFSDVYTNGPNGPLRLHRWINTPTSYSLSWIVPLHIPLLRLGPQAKKALDSAPIP